MKEGKQDLSVRMMDGWLRVYCVVPSISVAAVVLVTFSVPTFPSSRNKESMVEGSLAQVNKRKPRSVLDGNCSGHLAQRIQRFSSRWRRLWYRLGCAIEGGLRVVTSTFQYNFTLFF